MSFTGKLAYNLWFRPLAAICNSVRHGGPFTQYINAKGQKEMQAAAQQLPPFHLPKTDSRPFEIHMLTGERFVHQTAFCLYSLSLVCPTPLTPVIYDDGSLTSEDAAFLKRLCPALRIQDITATTAKLDQLLPASRYPYLRDRWLNYPHIRKLIDVHLGEEGWRLVLDSDLLFWREPRLLLDWAASPDAPIHTLDCQENYGYTRPLLEKVAGVEIPPLINVGICGLQSHTIDWDFLEHATATLIKAERTSYYLEQGLSALLIARFGHAHAAPIQDYITMPDAKEIAEPSAVMHHYVDTARGPYLRQAWKRLI